MKREIYSKLYSLLENEKDNRVIMIEGARQVGKSYLVKDVLSNIKKTSLCFDLEKDKKFCRQISKTENFDDFTALLKDQYNFKKNSILFIDEAQESQKLSQYVKSFKEDWKNIKVILTGSSMNRFFSKENRIPVGRTKSLCVFGFNFTEFIKYVKGDELSTFINSAPTKIEVSRHEYLLNLFDKYMYVGGYPEAVKSYYAGDNYTEIVEDIIASLEEDFIRKESVTPELFLSTMEGIANFIGSPSKYTHIKTTKYQAKKILETMKAWHLILEVKPQSFNPLHSSFLPKRYLYDLGVVNLMRAQAVPTLSMLESLNPGLRSPLGGLFENAALLNMLNGKSAKKSIYTWKKDGKSNIEVDFIFNLSNKKIPIECKATLSLKSKHFANVLQYLRLSEQKTGIIISASPYDIFEFDGGIKVINIPIYLATESNIIEYIVPDRKPHNLHL